MMRHLTIDSRMLAAGILAAAAATVVLLAIRPPETTDVLVAAGPVAIGTRLEAIDWIERPVVDPTGMIAVADFPDVADHLLAVDLDGGEPLVRSSLSSPADAHPTDVIGLELPSPAAVHGDLAPGDEIDVYVTSNPDTPLATGVTVVAVFSEDDALGAGDIGLLLAVDDALAPRLVAAVHDDAIHLVRRGE